LPNPVELSPGRQRRYWQAAGALAAGAGVLFSGLNWGWKLAAMLALGLVAVWWEGRRPRPVRIRPDEDEWRVLFSDGVERPAQAGTARGLWPGAITLRCGARRVVIFADECPEADLRRLKRLIPTP